MRRRRWRWRSTRRATSCEVIGRLKQCLDSAGGHSEDKGHFSGEWVPWDAADAELVNNLCEGGPAARTRNQLLQQKAGVAIIIFARTPRILTHKRHGQQVPI